jgi:hypothetical protein
MEQENITEDKNRLWVEYQRYGVFGQHIADDGRVILHHESGLSFTPPQIGRLGGINAKKRLECFGTLLNEPTFTNYEQFKEQVRVLDAVDKVPIYRPSKRADGTFVGRDDFEVQPIENRFELVSRVSEMDYGEVSNKYKVLQDADVFKPLVEVAERLNLNPIGRILGVGTGVTTFVVMFANKEYVIPLLTEHGENIILGVMGVNSYGQGRGCRAKIVGIRMVCINFNNWGDTLGQFFFPHYYEPYVVAQTFEDMLVEAVSKSPYLSTMIQNAIATPIQEYDLEDVLWYVDSEILVNDILPAPEKFCPEIKTQGLNVWTAYNTLTGATTYKAGFHRNILALDALTTKISKLLSTPLDDIISGGRANKKKMEETKKNQEKRKNERNEKEERLANILMNRRKE